MGAGGLEVRALARRGLMEVERVLAGRQVHELQLDRHALGVWTTTLEAVPGALERGGPHALAFASCSSITFGAGNVQDHFSACNGERSESVATKGMASKRRIAAPRSEKTWETFTDPDPRLVSIPSREIPWRSWRRVSVCTDS